MHILSIEKNLYEDTLSCFTKIIVQTLHSWAADRHFVENWFLNDALKKVVQNLLIKQEWAFFRQLKTEAALLEENFNKMIQRLTLEEVLLIILWGKSFAQNLRISSIHLLRYVPNICAKSGSYQVGAALYNLFRIPLNHEDEVLNQMPEDGRIIFSLVRTTGEIPRIALSADAKIAAVVVGHETKKDHCSLMLFDTNSCRLLYEATLKMRPGNIISNNFYFGPLTPHVVVGNHLCKYDSKYQKWDLIEFRKASATLPSCFSSDETTLLFCRNGEKRNSEILLYNLELEECINTIRMNDGIIRKVSLAPQYLLVQTESKVLLYSLKDGGFTTLINCKMNDTCKALIFVPDGNRLLIIMANSSHQFEYSYFFSQEGKLLKQFSSAFFYDCSFLDRKGEFIFAIDKRTVRKNAVFYKQKLNDLSKVSMYSPIKNNPYFALDRSASFFFAAVLDDLMTYFLLCPIIWRPVEEKYRLLHEK